MLLITKITDDQVYYEVKDCSSLDYPIGYKRGFNYGSPFDSNSIELNKLGRLLYD